VRGNWQVFNWHDASRVPSAIAELLVNYVTRPNQTADFCYFGYLARPNWTRPFPTRGSTRPVVNSAMTRIRIQMKALFWDSGGLWYICIYVCHVIRLAITRLIRVYVYYAEFSGHTKYFSRHIRLRNMWQFHTKSTAPIQWTAKGMAARGCLHTYIHTCIHAHIHHEAEKRNHFCLMNKSNTRTVVRECCKGDDESLCKRRKFDPPPPTNPQPMVTMSVMPTAMQKFYPNQFRGFGSAHVWFRAPRHKVTRLFLGFLRKATAETRAPILTQHTSNDAVLRKKVPFWGCETNI